MWNYNRYDNRFKNKYILELHEIAEIKLQNKPKITMDDICNVLIDIYLEEQKAENEENEENEEDEDSGMTDLEEDTIYYEINCHGHKKNSEELGG